MTTPRRYVRVRMYTHHGEDASWECICGPRGVHPTAAAAQKLARAHARTCPSVRAAMERDQLQRTIDTQLGGCSCHPDGDDYWDDRCALHGWSYRDWTDMADDLDKELAKVQDMRDQLRAELDRMRADRDRLRDRLRALLPGFCRG